MSRTATSADYWPRIRSTAEKYMITIEKDTSLKPFNTFDFDQRAEYYTEVSTEDQLSEAIEHAHMKSWPVFVLGGGSNIVLTRDIPGIVIRMVGAQIRREADSNTGGEIVTASAGKNWHELVLETLDMGLQGFENLSLIPGTVGAAPVQNIGAYGVEVKDRIVRVRTMHIPTGEWFNFTKEDCTFSYRHSFFKENPNQYAIADVGFSLGEHCPLASDYTSLADHLASRKLTTPTALEISESVVAIRKSKLPDPAVIGNAGSFFHNPVVSEKKAADLRQGFPGIVTFDAGSGNVKISAGWLIDQLGYKGLCRDAIGVYRHQALVLVHKGGSTGCALLKLADEITAKVAATYDLQLSIEPMVI